MFIHQYILTSAPFQLKFIFPDYIDLTSSFARWFKELLPEDLNNSRVLAFKKKAPEVKDGYQNSLKILYSQQTGHKKDFSKSTRHIPSAPVRILDAPVRKYLLQLYYSPQSLNIFQWDDILPDVSSRMFLMITT